MDINSKNSNKNMDTMTIHFPNGLLGFEEFKDFQLLSSETEKDLHWLQSTQDNQLEFAVTIPSVFQVDYEVTLNSEDEKLLNIDDKDELIILVTLSKNDSSSHCFASSPVLFLFLASDVSPITRGTKVLS